jgi:hypothetical protein
VSIKVVLQTHNDSYEQTVFLRRICARGLLPSLKARTCGSWLSIRSSRALKCSSLWSSSCPGWLVECVACFKIGVSMAPRTDDGRVFPSTLRCIQSALIDDQVSIMVDIYAQDKMRGGSSVVDKMIESPRDCQTHMWLDHFLASVPLPRAKPDVS